MADETDVMTIDQVARMLQMPRSSLYRLTAAREIPHVKIKRSLRFSRVAVQAWFDAQDVPVRAKLARAPDAIVTPAREVSTKVEESRQIVRETRIPRPSDDSDAKSIQNTHRSNGHVRYS
jgi:excisionase family DNA binding protein